MNRLLHGDMPGEYIADITIGTISVHMLRMTYATLFRRLWDIYGCVEPDRGSFLVIFLLFILYSDIS